MIPSVLKIVLIQTNKTQCRIWPYLTHFLTMKNESSTILDVWDPASIASLATAYNQKERSCDMSYLGKHFINEDLNPKVAQFHQNECYWVMDLVSDLRHKRSKFNVHVTAKVAYKISYLLQCTVWTNTNITINVSLKKTKNIYQQEQKD